MCGQYQGCIEGFCRVGCRFSQLLDPFVKWPLQLNVERSGVCVLVYLDPVQACQFGAGRFRADVIKALSNGRQIGVTTGLMVFVRSGRIANWLGC